MILLSLSGVFIHEVFADQITATIPVSSNDIVVNPDTNMIYATSSSGVTVIDGSTNNIVSTIQVESSPFSVDVNPVTNRVYVTHWDSMNLSSKGNVTVIDGETNRVVNKIQVGHAYDVAVNPVTNTIYVGASGKVTVIDGATDSVVTIISLGGSIGGLDVNPITNTIYVVCNCYDGHVAVIDGSTNTVTEKIVVTRTLPSSYVAVNPDTNKVYVTSRYSVAIIDGQTNEVLYHIGSCPNHPYVIDLNPNTNKIYVGCTMSEPSVAIIDGSTDTLITNLAVSGFTDGISVNTNTNRIYVATSNNITVIEGTTLETITVNTIDVLDNPLEGIWMQLASADGSIVAEGFTPITFDVIQGEQYTVLANNYNQHVFLHWEDGDTDSSRDVTPTTDINMTVTYTITTLDQIIP